MWKAGNVINRIGDKPPAVLIWDSETDSDIGEARTIEAARIMAAGPAMLAALQMALTALERSATERGVRHLEAVAVRDAIALATGAPTGEQAPSDDADSEGLATYRITETVAYLVKAEDEAHAERRFVCEVGIHADCFHAMEGRTIERVEEGEG